MLVRLALLLVSSAILPLGTMSPNQGFDYESQIGIAERSADGGGCLTIKNPSLAKNAPVGLVLPDIPQVRLKAVIEEKLTKPCPHDTELNPASSSYRLRVPATTEWNLQIAFAVAEFSGEFHLRDGLVRGDLSRNGIEDSFRSCASMEGLHYTVWNGEPLKGVRKWHHYYYVGYDLEPNCTKKDS